MPRYLVQLAGRKPSTDRRLDECESLEEAYDSASYWSGRESQPVEVWDMQAGRTVATFRPTR